jgi:hypothetical protein
LRYWALQACFGDQLRPDNAEDDEFIEDGGGSDRTLARVETAAMAAFLDRRQSHQFFEARDPFDLDQGGRWLWDPYCWHSRSRARGATNISVPKLLLARENRRALI